MMVTLERHTPRSGQETAVHGLRMGMVRGAWFLIPSRTRESDPRASLEMSNDRLRLELSDAGSRSRVGNTKRWSQTLTGESVTELVMVSLDLECAPAVVALGAYRSQHKPGGEVVRTEAPVDGVLTYIAGGRGI